MLLLLIFYVGNVTIIGHDKAFSWYGVMVHICMNIVIYIYNSFCFFLVTIKFATIKKKRKSAGFYLLLKSVIQHETYTVQQINTSTS